MFTEQFNPRHVIIGDVITAEATGFHIRARLVHDDVTDPRDSDDYNGRQIKQWGDHEWAFVGVVLSVFKRGVLLDAYATQRFGLTANFPGGTNTHLTTAANEMLDEAIERGKEVIGFLTSIH